jgi:hypothetical protein
MRPKGRSRLPCIGVDMARFLPTIPKATDSCRTREQGIGNRESGIENRELGIENREYAIGNRD